MRCGLGRPCGRERPAVASLLYRVPGPSDPEAWAQLFVCEKHAVEALKVGHTLKPA